MRFYYSGTNTIDHTNRLGFHKMPDGYALLQLDSDHFIYFHPESDEESAIHWNKWAILDWAKQDAKQRASK